MARGKEAAAAAAKRLAEAEARIRELQREVEDTKAAARASELQQAEALRDARNAAITYAAEAVQTLLTERAAALSNGLTAAWHKAARVAMTEHLTWLFLRGLVDWDRFDGDEAVLSFLATHGDLDTWFALTLKYAHRSNHADRRRNSRIPGATKAVHVIEDIHRVRKGDRSIEESRKALDALVEAARDAFTNVELDAILSEGDTVGAEASDEEKAWHAEIMAALPTLRDSMPPSVKRAADMAVPTS